MNNHNNKVLLHTPNRSWRLNNPIFAENKESILDIENNIVEKTKRIRLVMNNAEEDMKIKFSAVNQ